MASGLYSLLPSVLFKPIPDRVRNDLRLNRFLKRDQNRVLRELALSAELRKAGRLFKEGWEVFKYFNPKSSLFIENLWFTSDVCIFLLYFYVFIRISGCILYTFHQ